jgi:hypothetical protein
MCRHTCCMSSRAWASLLHLAPSRVHRGLPLRPCQEVPAHRRWQDIVIPPTYLVGNPSILRYRLMTALSYLFIDSLQPSHPNEPAPFRVSAHQPHVEYVLDVWCGGSSTLPSTLLITAPQSALITILFQSLIVCG